MIVIRILGIFHEQLKKNNSTNRNEQKISKIKL